MKRDLLRIVDANYNRAKEALRVIEDIFRFLEDDRVFARKCKALRHALTFPFKNKVFFKKMVSARDSKKDVGRSGDFLPVKKIEVQDLLYANFQRAKESLRVLEEIFKIINKKDVYKFKSLRYNLYFLEKSAQKKYSLHHT